MLLRQFGRQRRQCIAQGLPAVGAGFQYFARFQPGCEDVLDHRAQQPDVAVGKNRHVLIAARGFGAARIDHDHAARRRDPVQPLQGARLGDQRHLRNQRIGADHDQEIAMLEVGKGPVSRAAVHQFLRKVLGAGIDVDRVEALVAADRLLEQRGIDRVERRKGRGVALVRADRGAAVTIDDCLQAYGDIVQRLVPRNGRELARCAGTLQRRGDSVGIVGDRRHRSALDADVAFRHRMIAVGADPLDPSAANLGDEAALRLAQTAIGAVEAVGARHVGEGGCGHAFILSGPRGGVNSSRYRSEWTYSPPRLQCGAKIRHVG